ncbi:hypothetical protein EDB84DRAFT_1259484 [Lactarius hengduanensis]|nr:hypothetical protein EDB84DRAFT_1259484 [Lactarius hengduanensis]
MNDVQVRKSRPLCASPFDLTHSFRFLQTLLVDGYISRTFRSQAAEQYFLNLLKSSFIPPHTVLSYAGREGCFFFLHSVPSHIPVQHSGPPSCWLLDRGITDRGTVVPQKMWSPHSVPDRIRHVVAAQLQMPVFFEGEGGDLGIPLAPSTNGRCHNLRDASYPAPLGQKSSTYIRIVWPGYKEFKRQVQTREHTSTRNPISMAGFARQIGRIVDTFLQSDDDQRDLWRIWRGGIRGSDIVIIGAVQVSAGSWMPIIQLNRYNF